MYKSDKAIAQEFDNFKIENINKTGECSGWIEISFPNGQEHVGGTDYVCDHWIKYPHNSKIAFDNWYPDKVYFALCNAINEKFYK